MPRVTVIPPSINPLTHLPSANARKRRVAGYARVSTDSEEQQTSYEAQADYYTHYIQSKPEWEYADVDKPYGLNTKSSCMPILSGIHGLFSYKDCFFSDIYHIAYVYPKHPNRHQNRSVTFKISCFDLFPRTENFRFLLIGFFLSNLKIHYIKQFNTLTLALSSVHGNISTGF